MGPKFVPKSIPRFFILAARVVSKVVISRATPQIAVESVSVLHNVFIKQILGIHFTVATFY